MCDCYSFCLGRVYIESLVWCVWAPTFVPDDQFGSPIPRGSYSNSSEEGAGQRTGNSPCRRAGHPPRRHPPLPLRRVCGRARRSRAAAAVRGSERTQPHACPSWLHCPIGREGGGPVPGACLPHCPQRVEGGGWCSHPPLPLPPPPRPAVRRSRPSPFPLTHPYRLPARSPRGAVRCCNGRGGPGKIDTPSMPRVAPSFAAPLQGCGVHARACRVGHRAGASATGRRRSGRRVVG